MPLILDRCDDCGRSQYVCPNCGSTYVTALEDMYAADARKVMIEGGQDEVTQRNVCWDCGWTEKVVVEISREVTEQGGDRAIM